MKKPGLTGHAVIDLFGHRRTDQFFDELAEQYGFEAAQSIFLTTMERASRRHPRQTKPTGPHNPVQTLQLVALWDMWKRQHPGKGKYAWEQWLIEFRFAKRERGTYVRRLNEALRQQ